MKYSDAVEAFLLDRQISGVLDKTMIYYKYVLDRYKGFLTKPTLEHARTQIMPYFGQMQGETLSPSTIHGQMRGLRAFFRYCAEYDLCDPVKMPRLQKPKDSPTPLSLEEVAKVLKWLERRDGFSFQRDGALVRFYYDTGCRLNEALGVDIQDVDWENRHVHITRKGGKTQSVPFGRATLQALRRYIGLRSKYAPRYENALWVSHHGTRLKPSAVQTMCRKVTDGTSIKIHPHKLRHSFAVSWILNGGDAFTLQAILGHESQEMTSRYVKIAGADASAQHDRHSPGDRI